MKKIKLWEIGEDDDGNAIVKALESVDKTETEEQLENVIVQRPELLLKNLKLVGRQTATSGGPLDLLGVDSDGRLVIFELKRGNLTRDAVAQIVDYASYLSELDPEALSKHISERSGNLGIEEIDDFQDWYQEQFAEALTASQRPGMVLVGLGADDRTRRMVSFLADSDIDISLITFHAFKEDGKTFLARQIEVEARPPIGPQGDTKKDKLKKLHQKVASLHIEDFYFEMAEFFRDRLDAYEWPNPGGYSYYFSEITDTGGISNRVYISLYIYDAKPGKVRIVINLRAVESASDGFELFEQNLGDMMTQDPNGNKEIWIKSLQEWEAVRDNFESLCSAINSSWQSKRKQQIVEEEKAASQEAKE